MPHIGYKQSESHKLKVFYRLKQRPSNGWLGRKHSLDSIKKMRKPKSELHRQRMSEAAYRRWGRVVVKEQWQVMRDTIPEPIQPMSYRDIFMDDRCEVIDGDVWFSESDYPTNQ